MTKLGLLLGPLGGTITMLPTKSGGIACELGAEIGAETLFRPHSRSLRPGHPAEVPGRIKAALSAGIGPALLRCP